MLASIILEFGSHSLKVHYRSRTSGVFRKVRFVWNMGHEVYSGRPISAATKQQAVENILQLRDKGFSPRSLLAIATGALRDASNRDEFLKFIEQRVDINVRVISGREEASLLAQGYLQHSNQLPALLADIGGGSLELVYLGRDKTILRDSLPLGAIRLYHLGAEADKSWDYDLVAAWIESNFEESSVVTCDEVHCTGGSAKAISKILSKPTFTVDELAQIEEDVKKNGPPSFLKDDRARVFLPGLMALRRLMIHSHAKHLTYLKVSVGRIFLEQLAQRIQHTSSERRKQYIAQDIHITSIHPKSATNLPKKP